MEKFAQVQVDQLFTYRDYVFRRIKDWQHPEAGWVNARRQDGYCRLFYDDVDVEVLHSGWHRDKKQAQGGLHAKD